jgi:hypothetical protein
MCLSAAEGHEYDYEDEEGTEDSAYYAAYYGTFGGVRRRWGGVGARARRGLGSVVECIIYVVTGITVIEFKSGRKVGGETDVR